MANTVQNTILKGIYTRKRSNGDDVHIPFSVERLEGNDDVFFFIDNYTRENRENRFKFNDIFKLTRITGGVPVEISDDKVDYKHDDKDDDKHDDKDDDKHDDKKYIFFGDTKVHTEENFMPYRHNFFRVTPKSYDYFINNIIDREIPWENVELRYRSNDKLTCSLEGTWAEFFKGGSYRKRTRRPTHRKPTKRRRNRRGNRKTKKN